MPNRLAFLLFFLFLRAFRISFRFFSFFSRRRGRRRSLFVAQYFRIGLKILVCLRQRHYGHSIQSTAARRTPHTFFLEYTFSCLENQLLPFGMLHCSKNHRTTTTRVRKTEAQKKKIDQICVRLFLLPQPHCFLPAAFECVFFVNRTLEINRLSAAANIHSSTIFDMQNWRKKKRSHDDRSLESCRSCVDADVDFTLNEK